MQSNFAPTHRQPGATASPAVEETYDLKGLNLISPDEIMPPGESPWTINSRMYARNDGESRVASRTRQGASFLSTPVGEALNVQNVAANTGDAPFTRTNSNTYLALAQPFTPNASGRLTRLDLNIKKLTGATGHIIVEIYDNLLLSGNPPTLLAQSSILSQNITTTYQYLTAYFIDAPSLVIGTQYWLKVYIQDNGVGTYYLNKTATVVQAQSTTTGTSWTALGYSVNYKTYLSTTGGVRGFHLRYPSNSTNNRIMMAHRDKVWAIPKLTGIPTSIDTGLDDSNNPVRFAQYNDNTYYVNGVNHCRVYNGTTVADLGGTMQIQNGTPTHVIIWQNRMFLVGANNRVDFSDLGDPTSFTSVNFFYVPAPLSPDHITGWIIFQDHLVIFTHETKHIILGSDISTFTRKEAIGTKGAVSQEAIDADRNMIYFMADDKQIYSFNGVSDKLLSEKIQPELEGITDTSKVRLEVYRNQLRVYYPKSPSATNNRMALLDLETQQWFLDTDHPVTGSSNLYLDANELIEFSALTGQVFYGETQFSDLGKMIDYKFWTNYKTYAYRRRNGQTFGGGSSKKRIKRFRPVVRTTDSPFNLSVGKDMDFLNQPDMRDYLVDSGGAKWGAFTWGDGTIWGSGNSQIQNRAGMSGRGQYIQYRFERKGVETPCELYGYIAMYRIGRQK